jgi:hypothetical protein
MRKIQKAIEQNNYQTPIIENQQELQITNKEIVDLSNLYIITSKKKGSYTLEFETMDSLINSNIEEYYYKSWTFKLYEGTPENIERFQTSIIANTNAYIIYDEAVENPFNFYNTGQELREFMNFNIKDNTIYFNASVYLTKPFNAKDFTISIPSIKLQVEIKPFIRINT